MSIRKTKNKEKIAARKNKDGYGISDGILIYFIQTISVFANEIGPNPAIEARADIIEWRYKLENGRVYKRRYNYTKQKWIGDWIPA